MGGNRKSSRTFARGLGLAGVGTALVLLLSGCLRDVGAAFGGFGWPQGGITDQSQRMYDLWIGSVVAALLVGLLVWGLIFWCLVRYRKRGEELPVQTRFNLPMEVLYTLTPFLVIAVLFYYTVVVQADVEYRSPDPDVTVGVTAFKWNWQFDHLGTSGPDGNPVSVTGTTDQVPVLVVPTDRTVLFQLESQDVIHSFWVPELLFKRDVFPGSLDNEFELSILVDREGAYVGRCAEFCGTHHSMMNFELRAVSPGDYAEYVSLLESGASQGEALVGIGGDPEAVTTGPFDTRRGGDR